MNELFDRKMTVQACVKDKKEMLLFHGITNDHVRLLDRLLEEMHKDRTSFFPKRLEDELDNLSDEELRVYAGAALKASMEWHIFEPFMEPATLEKLREL